MGNGCKELFYDLLASLLVQLSHHSEVLEQVLSHPFFFLRYEIKMVRNLAFLYSQFSDDEHVRFVFNHIHQFNEVGMRNLLQNVNLNVKSLKLQPRKVSLVHHFRRQRFPSVPLICNLNHGKLSALNVLEKMLSVKKQKGDHFFRIF